MKRDSPKFFRFRVFFADSIPRGLALFFAAFTILNLIGSFRSPGFDANIWWVDLHFLPTQWANILLGFSALFLIALAVRPPISKGRQFLTAGLAGLIALLAMLNAVQFYKILAAENVKSSFPVPLSAFVCVAFIWIMTAAFRQSSAVLYSNHAWGILVVFAGALFIFPLLQMVCFGKTDYRRPADVIVVLGARAYADGRPSDALADRVRTACELYEEGMAKKLIFSGGPGDGMVHETEAMRRFAVQLGVNDEDIFADVDGLNTQATVRNTLPIFEKLNAQRILVVSHFFHLPRIKMTYQRAGWDVYTVPAKEKYILSQTPYLICREVAALWVYYMRPITGKDADKPVEANAVKK